MAIDPSTILSVGGSLLKGLFGRKKKNDLDSMLTTAQKWGLSPLAAIGSPAAASYGSPVGSHGTGDVIGDAMERLGNDISNKKQAALDERLREAQIETEEAKAAALRAEATSRTRISSARGTGPKPIPLYVEYIDRDGNILYGPNADLPEFEQMPVPGMIHGTDVFVGGQGAAKGIHPGRYYDGKKTKRVKPVPVVPPSQRRYGPT